MPRFAANLTMMFNEWSFLDRFAAAADAGFTAVEFLFPYEHEPAAIADALRRQRLELALFNMPPGDWAAGERGLAALPARFEDLRTGVTQALDYGLATGVRRMHLMAGIAPAAASDARAAFERAVRFVAEALHPHGIDVVLEPINPRDMPGYFLNDFAVAAELVRRLALPNLKLQFDIYHRQIIHGDVIRGLEALMPIIGHVQVASVPARNEPGTGELDDGRIFDTLDALGYEGYVGCEYRPRGGTLDGLSWLRP